VLETLETDLWQQYNELGGIQDSEVPGGTGSKEYTTALSVLDSDMAQYVHDNTDDEFSHFTFLNAYLRARGETPVNMDPFRTLPSSQATGAQQIGRLTNLMELTVDTSWWTKYRSASKNPDFGDTFPQAVPGLSQGRFPAIPRSDADLKPREHLQAIANTAGFHFAFIEQGGTSLYPSLAQRVTDPEVLRVLLSIGPTEAMHFQTWHDKAGNAPPLRDPTNGLVFPDLNSSPFGGQDFQTNLIMPEPTIFLRRAGRRRPARLLATPIRRADPAGPARLTIPLSALTVGGEEGVYAGVCVTLELGGCGGSSWPHSIARLRGIDMISQLKCAAASGGSPQPPGPSSTSTLAVVLRANRPHDGPSSPIVTLRRFSPTRIPSTCRSAVLAES
jgi:hypothetical protein